MSTSGIEVEVFKTKEDVDYLRSHTQKQPSCTEKYVLDCATGNFITAVQLLSLSTLVNNRVYQEVFP